MHALTNTVEKAKQTLSSLALATDYSATNDMESVVALDCSVAAIQANQHHYRELLARYHQIVTIRSQLIDGPPHSINQLLKKLSTPLIKDHFRGRAVEYRQLIELVWYIRRQGHPPCPDDIMHPVFQHKHQSFKRLHVGIRNKCAELIAYLHHTSLADSPLFSVDQLIDTCGQLQQRTAELDDIEGLIRIRYQQQVALHQEVRVRLLAIKCRNRTLKTNRSTKTDLFGNP